MHVGHLIARLGHFQLARALVERHHEDWRRLMNCPTFLMKPPLRWTPLMSCLEATRPLARNMEPDQRTDLMRMIVAIVQASSVHTLMNTAVSGGTFVHMARGADCLRTALTAIVAREGNTQTFGRDLMQKLINISGKNGHSAYDLHWNNGALKAVVKEFGGVSVCPMPGAHGKGKHGKPGKGSKDGLGPENWYNRQYHNPTASGQR